MRGDRSHECQVRYNSATGQREDRTALSLIPLERAGMIEYESQPVNPVRYYSVKISEKGIAFPDEYDALQKELS